MASRGRDKFQKAKPLILLLSKFYNLFPKKFRIKLLEHYRATKGIRGLVLRYALLKTVAVHCGDNVSVHPGVYLLHVQTLSIGNNVSIHPMCYIDASGEIEIGDDVSIAHGCTILSTTHTYAGKDIPIKDQPVEQHKTVVQNNVWLGAKATVLCGLTVQSGAVIGANAVVTKDVPENAVVAGVPAKVIKDRCAL